MVNNFLPQEIEKFNSYSDLWWDPEGMLGTLHTINPLRVSFIMDSISSQAPSILDVGCGGGILSEALAKKGARVTGIDLSETAVNTARAHALQQGLEIDYRVASAEYTAEKHPGKFDAVTCLEMLEHVPDPASVISACARALKPGGTAVFSSINRTLKAFLFAVLIGEYILGLLPKGSHKFAKLIKPAELKAWCQRNNLVFKRSASLIYNPLNSSFKLALDREDINYLLKFSQPLLPTQDIS